MDTTAAAIRQQFIDFFVRKHGHVNVPSSPVVPHQDPTLLFANAGMNQFKPYFLGTETATSPRVVNSQKCIRAGGKHNDLEDVGRDTYHHTFFEMLGNWSFGDYFKEGAIDFAWELLTTVWSLDPARLHATYFEGDASEGLEPDHEARDLWLRYLPAEQVHPGNKKDNFWEMGDTGPCGPCSELHYDGTEDLSGGPRVNADDPDVIEIWNLVFIQFNRSVTGALEPLPARHVDTGMGFERIVRVLQGKRSNYDTDVFSPLFAAIQAATGARAYSGLLDDPVDTAYRVLADHIRTLTFALTDGAHCGNEGRNYVLRRILRRAVKYGRLDLGVEQPFFYKLVPAVVDTFGDAFPELKRDPESVAREIRDEEQSFGRTLHQGLKLFDEAAARAAVEGRAGGEISASDAFTLHDTFGFPIDLTSLLAQERGLTVAEAGFDALMEEARERSRAGGAGGDAMKALHEQVMRGLEAGWYGPTNYTGDTATESPFQKNTRYFFKLEGGDWLSAPRVAAGDRVAVVLGMTPFYAESGGQVGDTGTIQSRGGGRVRVTDTRKIGPVTVHLGEVVAGSLTATEPAAPGRSGAGGAGVAEVTGADADGFLALAVDADRRAATAANHTGTHLLNQALRAEVGPGLDQRGSLVEAERLRFDFTHPSPLSPEQVAAVEARVNACIDADLPVSIGSARKEQALTIRGLRAVFGEKYPPEVRVVAIGASVNSLLAAPQDEAWETLSIELCGGTHLAATGAAGRFRVVSQEAVSKGIRRLTAVTGDAAVAADAAAEEAVQAARELGEAAAGATPQQAEQLGSELAELLQTLEQDTLPLLARQQIREAADAASSALKQLRKQASAAADDAVKEAVRVLADGLAGQDAALLVRELPGADGKSLKLAADILRKRAPGAACLLAAADAEAGKVALLAIAPEAWQQRGLRAGDWIKAVAPKVGGGGGGRPDMAQAGGKDVDALPEALTAATAYAEPFRG